MISENYSEKYLIPGQRLLDEHAGVGGKRSDRLGVLFRSMIFPTVDCVCGVGMAAKHDATGFTSFDHFHNARKYFKSANSLFLFPYVNFLRFINPVADFTTGMLDSEFHADCIEIARRGKEPFIKATGKGLVFGLIAHWSDTARNYRDAENIFTRHVATRAIIVAYGIACVITRVVDLVIGLIAALFSCLLLGRVELLNNVAFRELQAGDLLFDIFYATSKFVNPWAGNPPARKEFQFV